MAIQIFANYRKPTNGILQSPDPRLKQPSVEVEKINDETIQIVDKLIKITKKVDAPYKPWLGMAAPQIRYNVRIVLVKEKLHKYTVMINPEILQQKFFLPSITACYSLPGIYFRRHHFYFKVRYKDLNNKTHIRVYKGGKALAFQQEIDHINGILACD